jgi:hypothetical protein
MIERVAWIQAKIGRRKSQEVLRSADLLIKQNKRTGTAEEKTPIPNDTLAQPICRAMSVLAALSNIFFEHNVQLDKNFGSGDIVWLLDTAHEKLEKALDAVNKLHKA